MIVLFLFSFLIDCFSQKKPLSDKLTLLSSVSDIPFDSCPTPYNDCGDNIIWEIVKHGKSAILPLIEKMSDTTYSKTYYKENGKVIRIQTGVIAYLALEQIISLPIAKITGHQFDVFTCGWYPYGLIGSLNSFKFRKTFQNKIRDYYTNTSFKWVKYSKDVISRCARIHGITGHYYEK